MMEFNRSEKDSILFYQGGGEHVRLSSRDQGLRGFYDAKDPYMVIDVLLMPGIDNERARLQNEDKKFDFALLEHMDELVRVYENLYSAMCKYTIFYERESRLDTYRTDRMNTLSFLQQGQTSSFMATMKVKKKDAYFCDKDGLLLLEISSPGDIEHVDVNAVLGEESVYPDENEILYGPYVYLNKEALEITEEERQYEDRNHQPPKDKYRLNFMLSSIVARNADSDKSEMERLYQKVLRPGALQSARHVWESLMGGREPEQRALEDYVAWKEALQIYVKMRFAQIKWNIQSEKSRYTDRLVRLKDDIQSRLSDADANRRKYEMRVEIIGLFTALLYPAAALALALSYVEGLEPWLKGFSLVATAVGAVLLSVAKAFAWAEKLKQRTDTLLKLDELNLAIAYEREMTEEKLDGYVERFLKILQEDNRNGLKNSEASGSYLKGLEKAEKE